MRFPVFWQHRGLSSYLLSPLSVLFYALVQSRAWLFRHGYCKVQRVAVPVVVIGNISIGGTGKTPLIRYLADALRQQGRQPGIISRGYGGSYQGVRQVLPGDDAKLVGDEPLLLARDLTCPVFICRDRVAAAQALLSDYPTVDVLLADDGLQHYRLGRDIEIAVIDGTRGLGNGCLLPAGPLRETPQRLAQTAAIVIHGKMQQPLAAHPQTFTMHLTPGDTYQLKQPQQRKPLSAFQHQSLAAIAAIGHPQRFFQMLHDSGLRFQSHALADHYHHLEKIFASIDTEVILLTEKDAVKLDDCFDDRIWVVPVSVDIAPDLAAWLNTQLATIKDKAWMPNY